MANRRVSPISITPRHVWLAGLGALVLARREAASRRDRLGEAARESRRRLLDAVKGRVRPVLGRVEPAALRFVGEVEGRLSPVLGRVGLKLGARPAAARGRAPARRPARRSAGTVRRRKA